MAKKSKKKLPNEHWMPEPQEHDFPAATDYLSLLFNPVDVSIIVTTLQGTQSEMRQAKDLLRASGLALLPANDFHVALDLQKVKRGEKLSPVLLVRGSFSQGLALTIADGYHRICASYHISENTDIPCMIADIPNLQLQQKVSPAPAQRKPRSTLAARTTTN